MEIKPIAMYEDGDSELAKHNIISLSQELEKYKNIVDELEKEMRERYHKEIDYQSKIMRSDLMQGDYPVSYYYSEQNEKLLNYYLNKLNELKGAD